MSGRYGYAAGYGGQPVQQQQQHPAAYQGQQAGHAQQAYAAAGDQAYSTQHQAYPAQQWGAQAQAAAPASQAGTYQSYGAAASAQPAAAAGTSYSQPAYYQTAQQGQAAAGAASYAAAPQAGQGGYAAGYTQYGGQQQAGSAAPAPAAKAPVYAAAPTYTSGAAARGAPAYAAAATAPTAAAGGGMAVDAQYTQQPAPRALGYAPGYAAPVKSAPAAAAQAARPAGAAYQDRAGGGAGGGGTPRQQGYGGAPAGAAAGQGAYGRPGGYEAPAAAGGTAAAYNQPRGGTTGMYAGQAQPQQQAGAGGAPYPAGAGGRSGFSQGPAAARPQQYGAAQQPAASAVSPRAYQSGSGQAYSGAGGYGSGAGGGGGGYGAASEYGAKGAGRYGAAGGGGAGGGGAYSKGAGAASYGQGGGAQAGRAGRTAGPTTGRSFEPHPAQQQQRPMYSDRQRDTHSRRDDSRGAGFSRSANKDERAGSSADRDRGWRGGDKAGSGGASRKRSRSPPPAARSTPASDKRAARSSSPPRARARDEYGVRVPAFTFSTIERDYPELARRYAKLSIPPDFSLARMTWPMLPGWGAQPADTLGLTTVHMDRPVRFEHEVCSLDAEPHPPGCEVLSKRLQEAAAPHTDRVRYAVRVVLLQGMTQLERAAVARGPHHEGGMHMAHALRFVTARFIDAGHKRGVLGALGGMWHAELDGGDPTAEDGAALKAAAIRHAKAQTGLDLSCCTQWHRICDIHYLRPPHNDSKKDVDSKKEPVKQEEGTQKEDGTPKEADAGATETSTACSEEWPLHVVMFCVPADELMPELTAWPSQYAAIQAWRDAKQAAEDQAKADQDAKQTPASDGGAGAQGAAAGSAAPNGSSAPTAPTSLLPEPFIHIKGQHNSHFKVRTAASTLHSLLDYDEEDEDEPTFELCVFAEAMHELLMRDYAATIMAHLSSKRYPAPPFEEQHPQDAAQAPDHKVTSRRTDMPLLLAFRYFDRTGCGYIKPEDVRRLLHNVGAHLPHRLVKQLLANMQTAIGGKHQDGGRLYYRQLTDKGGSSSHASGRSSRERSLSPPVAPPPPPVSLSEQEVTAPASVTTHDAAQPVKQEHQPEQEAAAPAPAVPEQQHEQPDSGAGDAATTAPAPVATAMDITQLDTSMDVQPPEAMAMQAEPGQEEAMVPDQEMVDAPAVTEEPATDFIPVEDIVEEAVAVAVAVGDSVAVAVHESVTMTAGESVPVVIGVDTQHVVVGEAPLTVPEGAAEPAHAVVTAGVEAFEVDGGQVEDS